MGIKRRDFIKGCTAAGAFMLPGMTMAAQVANANNAQSAAFSIAQAHTQSAGLTYANIEHFGNQYKVASANLLDWKIVSAV